MNKFVQSAAITVFYLIVMLGGLWLAFTTAMKFEHLTVRLLVFWLVGLGVYRTVELMPKPEWWKKLDKLNEERKLH